MIKPILILAAMKGEMSGIAGSLTKVNRSKTPFGALISGYFEEKQEVVICLTGVGKTLAAACTQYLIDYYHPFLIICSGIGGALLPHLKLYDVVLAKDLIQHDMDAEAFNFSRGEIPYLGIREIIADEKISSYLLQKAPKSNLSGKLYEGRILSGDVFVNSGNITKYPYLIEELKGDIVEMEGAAVGLVAFINNIPFIVVRTISDSVPLDQQARFSAVQKASMNNLKQILSIIVGMED